MVGGGGVLFCQQLPFVRSARGPHVGAGGGGGGGGSSANGLVQSCHSPPPNDPHPSCRATKLIRWGTHSGGGGVQSQRGVTLSGPNAGRCMHMVCFAPWIR